MKYAKFSDDFLSYFRLDDNGETLVLTDKRGYTRAVKLLPYEERQQGEWIPCYVNFTDGSKPLFAYCKCSLCNKPAASVYKFCPNCGASMKPKTCTNCETFGKDCGDCEVGDDD